MKYELVQDYLAQAFKLFGESEAVRYKKTSYTYKQLNNDSSKVANKLQAIGVEKGDLVGTLLEDKYQAIVAMIGIWKIGAVFVPFNQEYPLKRIYEMIESCGASYLIRDDRAIGDELLNSVETISGIDYQEFFDAITDYEEPELLPTDGAYLYFTSGTTGKPKPILGMNRSLAQFIEWEINEFAIEENTRVSQLTPICHDPYLRDVLVPLFAGGVLCIPEDKKTIISRESFIGWLNDEAIELMHCTPSLFASIKPDDTLKDSFRSLKNVLLAGEKIVPNSLRDWYEVFGDRIQLVNVYGPTETTLAKLFYRISPTDIEKNAIPVGKPIAGAQAIILNDNLKPCPVGAVGMIYIRTPYRTLGYFRDDELNKEKFIVNPFNNSEDDLIYKTGDLGRTLVDGNIEFVGRADRQVKIRGFRVELTAIENALLKIESIKDAAVVFQNDDTAKLLKAFIVTEESETEDNWEKEIHEILAAELPDYMLPNKLITLDKLPMTSNNKLDYKALEQYKVEVAEEVALPETKTEEVIHEIYCTLLNQTQIDVNQSFFELGGNSLNSMALIGEVQRQFGVELPLGMIFENGSIRGIAAFIDENIGNEKDADGINHVEDAESYPVTGAQKRMYLLNEMMGPNTIYNLPNVVKITGNFDVDVLKASMEKIVNRHESLRTTFEVVDDEIIERVHETMEVAVSYEKLSGRSIDTVIKEFVKPFDLQNGPLIRVAVVEENSNVFYLMFDMHHIISDGTSLGIFVRELMQICGGKELEPLKLQYRDFAAWQRDRLSEENQGEQEKFWLEQFKDEVPVLDFPADYPRPLIKTYNGAKVEAILDTRVMDKISKFARNINVSEFAVYYCAYLILLHKYTGQDEFVVGTPVQGRNHYELQNMIGMFVNTLPLKNPVDSDNNTAFFIRDVQSYLTDALENSEYQLDDLIEKLDLVRDTSRNPLFDTVFGYHDYDVSGVEIEGIEFENYALKDVTAKFDFELAVINRNRKVSMQIEYCTDLFAHETMERFMKYYELILTQITNMGSSIKDINLLSEADKNIVFTNQEISEIGYPQKTVVELFEEVVSKYPLNTALTFGDKHMTYKELNTKANLLAKQLREYGVGPDTYVPLVARRSFEMIIGILAIIKAGGAYVPINPDYPAERIRYMLKQVDADVIVRTDAGITLPLDDSLKNVEIIDLSDVRNYVGTGENLKKENTINDNLYVIFTSGTTGNPKGVVISHYNLVRLLFNDRNLYDFNQNDVWMMFHEFCFDFSVWEMYGALLNGGRLVLLDKDVVRDTYAVSNIIAEEKVTVFNQVPSAFYNYIKVDSGKKTNLRYLIFGGEKLVPTKIAKWCENHKDVRVINMYGITETTVHVTYKELKSADLKKDTSNIGRPIPTLKTYILNGDELCGIGIPGELCVAGLGLAKGYLNNSKLTEEKFVNNPVYPGERIYRSGDLAKWLPNGELEYLGRIDEQVQLRGFRIELGEIESKLREYAGISDVIAAVREKNGDEYLVAYYVAKDEQENAKLREYLLKRLPEYMVPQFFVRVDEIKLTTNGKADKRALPDITIENESAENALPENEMEEALVQAWINVLGLEKVSVTDNFFLLGGDSIKALQVVSELKKSGLTTKVDLIFHYQTIRELAPYVEEMTQVAEQGIITGEVTLLPIQNWFLNNNPKNYNHWNQAVLLAANVDIDEDYFEGALQKVVLHHDALRTVFNPKGLTAEINGIGGSLFEFELCETAGCCDSAFMLAKANQLQEEFDVENGPLFKSVMFRDGDDCFIFICAHHLVIDSISWQIILDDLIHSYYQLKDNEENSIPLKTDSVKAWAEALKDYWNKEKIDDEIKYWSDLVQSPSAKLNVNRDVDNTYKNNEKQSITINPTDTSLITTEVNVAYNTETQDILLSALARALSVWSGDSKYFINLESHGREAEAGKKLDVTRTVGWFTSLYPVLLDSDYADEGMLIKSTKEMLRRIPSHGIGYGILNYMKESPYKGTLDVNTEIGFSFFGDINNTQLGGDFEMVDMHYGNLIGDEVTRPYILDIVSFIENGRLVFEVNYNKLHFSKEQIETLLQHISDSLLQLGSHCLGKKSVEYTPDDFGSNEISMDELAFILEAADSIG